MDKEYTYIIFEKSNKEVVKAVAKILKTIKEDYKIEKHSNIGCFTIYRIYGTFDKYYEHKLHTISESKDYYLELDFDNLDPIQSEYIKKLFTESNFDILIDEDNRLDENISPYNLATKDKKSFIYFDKKKRKVFFGKFGNETPIFILEDEYKSKIVTNSEYIKSLLNEEFKTLLTLNGEGSIYELTDCGDIKRNDIFQDEEKQKTEEPRINPLLPQNVAGIENILKKGEFLTDKVYSLNPSLGREEEIRELEKNLMIPKKGVIIVGKTGIGKTAIVEGLAYKIRGKEVCDKLKNKRILSISIPSLTAGTRMIVNSIFRV